MHKLGEYMNEVAIQTLKDVDLVLWLVDASVPPTDEDRAVAKHVGEVAIPAGSPVLLALNKVDLISGDALDANQAAYQELLPQAVPLRLSALSGYETDRLLKEMIDRLPEGEPFFSEDQVTDLYERDIAAELIREAALLHLRDEVPHSIAVRMDEYRERGDTGAYIAATLLVERNSQKGIVIGKGGEMLKLIGSTARREIEAMSSRRVFLELRVKVNKNWRNDPFVLNLLGYMNDTKKKK